MREEIERVERREPRFGELVRGEAERERERQRAERVLGPRGRLERFEDLQESVGQLNRGGDEVRHAVGNSR